MFKRHSKWGRIIPPLVASLTLAFAFVLSPIGVRADAWVSGFLRDATGNLDVNISAQSGAALNVACSSGCAGAPQYTIANAPASATCVAPSVCVIKNAPGTLHNIVSLTTAGSAQPAGLCVWYDNAAAASGTIIYQENGIGAGQVVTLDAKTSFGITMQCAANPGGGGINTEFN